MSNHPIDRLSAYLDNELEEVERQQMDTHLVECESCRELLADLAEMQNLISSAYRSIKAPIDLEQKVLIALDEQSATSKWAGFGLTAVPIVGLLLLFVIMFLYGSVLLKLLSILLSFMVTAAHVFSHIASSIPVMWGAIFLLAVCVFLLSGLSLRRILRSTTSQ
jgi:anti-sigma factor RsiW